MGLGALAKVSLVEARGKAARERALVGEGIDPIERANAQVAAPASGNSSAAPTF